MPDATIEGVSSHLARIASLADSIGADDVGREARAFAQRAAAGRLFVACLGQFKRGKSTLLNTLVDWDVLPVGIAPVTSVVTVLRHGPDRRAVVRYSDGRSLEIDPATLVQYVTEAQNPGNAKAVALVEIFAPNALLATGVSLVDTPGIGSVSLAGSDVTRRFIPHVDAALVVVGVDPPITEDEMRLVEQVTHETRSLLFVLNKADKSSQSEIDEARIFTEWVIEERLRAAVALFVVSAAERRALQSPTRDWALMEAAVKALTSSEGDGGMRWRERRVIKRFLRQLQGDVTEQQRALAQPLAETEVRVRALERWLADAESEMRELSHRLTGRQEALSPVFAKMRDGFLHDALPAAARDLRARTASLHGRWHFHESVMSLAQEISEQYVRRWLDEVEPVAAAHYSKATARFASLVNELLEGLSAAEPSLASLTPLEPDPTFRVNRGFYFTGLMRLASGALLPSVAAAAGIGWGRRRVLRQGLRYLRRLIEVNSHRTYEDLRERVAVSRRQLEVELRARLNRLSESARRALDRAAETQRLGHDAVRSEEARLTDLLTIVDAELNRLPS